MWICDSDKVQPRDLYRIELQQKSPTDPSQVRSIDCVDPYARGVSSARRFGEWSKWVDWMGAVTAPDLDPLPLDGRPKVERHALRIMEMHLRGWTATADVEHPGTFGGAIEKLDHLHDLGVNTIELMPVLEYDECRFDDFWGYNPVQFFSPMGRYTASSFDETSRAHPHDIMEEVRRFTDAAHERGMQVIVDMVLNHTGEGDEQGAPISLKATQPSSFIRRDGWHQNFTGCGNTLNANSPRLAALFRAALRFWVETLGVDGFRLDLAAVLLKDEEARNQEVTTFFEQVAQDDILKKVLWIAEPWGPEVYRLGHFGYLERKLGLNFVEWNDRYREAHQRFMLGDGAARGELAHHLVGSLDIFQNGHQSLRYVTCHDGLCLMDLISESRGQHDERTWMNHLALLIGANPGPMMLLSGDEVGGTRHGDHNPWNHAEANYFDWSLLEKHPQRKEFVQALLGWRATHPALTSPSSAAERARWHGVRPFDAAWHDQGLPLVVEYTGERHVLAAINPHGWSHSWELPTPPAGHRWRYVCNTGDDRLQVIPDESSRPFYDPAHPVLLGENSVILLESVPTE